MPEIYYYRNDRKPIRVTVRDKTSLQVVDISLKEFTLTVDPSEDPADALNNVMQLTGVVEDGPAGKVLFTPIEGDTDFAPGEYFFDVQMQDGGGANRTTVAKGEFHHLQDITK